MSIRKDDLNEISDEELLKEVEEILDEDKENKNNKDKEENNKEINKDKEENIEEEINKDKEEINKDKEENTEEEINKDKEENIEEINKDTEEENNKEINKDTEEENNKEINKENENEENKEINKEEDNIEIIKNKKVEDICNMIQKKIPNINTKDLEAIKKVIEKEKNKSEYIEKVISKIKKINKKIILQIVFFIIIFLSFTLIFKFLTVKTKNKAELCNNNLYKLKDAINIKQVENTPNNSNYIYISKSKKIGEDTFNLIKMLIDENKTIFYFDKVINLNKYNLTLEDNKNNFYNININKRNKNYVEFDNLEKSIKGLILTIEEKNTKNKDSFIFIIKGGVKLQKNLYLNDNIDILKNNMFDFKINKSIFSSINTEISYVIEEKENNSLFFERANITQGNINLPLKEKEFFKKDNIVLGKLTFSPLYNLQDNIQIKFYNVYESNVVNKEVEINKLFDNFPDNEIKIEVNNKNIILERLGLINEKCVLVMHTLDENNKRIKSQLDAVIKYTNELGEEIILNGDSKSKTEGTDMIFDIKDKDKDIRNYSLILDIKNIKYEKDNIIKNINLNSGKKEDEDTKLIKSASYVLENKGYSNVKNITYNREKNKFLGVFISKKKETIYKYFIEGTKYNDIWNFKTNLISKENIS